MKQKGTRQKAQDLLDASRDFAGTNGPSETSEKKMQLITLGILKSLSQIFNKEELTSLTKEYEKLIQEEAKEKIAHVRSAVALSNDQEEKLRKKLSEIFNEEIALNVKIDKELSGGLVIKYKDMLIDGSLTAQLKKLSEQVT